LGPGVNVVTTTNIKRAQNSSESMGIDCLIEGTDAYPHAPAQARGIARDIVHRHTRYPRL
jgi:hypothetical protein